MTFIRASATYIEFHHGVHAKAHGLLRQDHLGDEDRGLFRDSGQDLCDWKESDNSASLLGLFHSRESYILSKSSPTYCLAVFSLSVVTDLFLAG